MDPALTTQMAGAEVGRTLSRLEGGVGGVTSQDD